MRAMETLNKDADSLPNPSLARLTAVCLALGGFSIALIGGLASGAEANEVLFRAVISLFVCYMVGYVLGAVGERVVDEAVQRSVHDTSDPAHSESSSVQAPLPITDHLAGAPAAEVVN